MTNIYFFNHICNLFLHLLYVSIFYSSIIGSFIIHSDSLLVRTFCSVALSSQKSIMLNSSDQK